jgi:hypothetical protein
MVSVLQNRDQVASLARVAAKAAVIDGGCVFDTGAIDANAC